MLTASMWKIDVGLLLVAGGGGDALDGVEHSRLPHELTAHTTAAGRQQSCDDNRLVTLKLTLTLAKVTVSGGRWEGSPAAILGRW